MKIIDPSFHIQDELDGASLAVRLEACGRVCYKSEDKITENSAIPFVAKIAEHGHNSVLEMAVLTFKVACHKNQIEELLACQPKFLLIDILPEGVLITGSVRALREIYLQYRQSKIINHLIATLVDSYPYLFAHIFDPARDTGKDDALASVRLNLSEVDQLSHELRLRHRFVGVKFVVNRAVTHELVRHRPCSFLQESQRYCRYSEDKFDNQVTFIKPLFFQEDSKEFKLWQDAMADTEAAYFKLLETATPQAARTVLPNSCKTEIIVFCNLLEWQHIFSLRTSTAAEPSMREIMIPLHEEMQRRYKIY